jgi:hypothetical protein
LQSDEPNEFSTVDSPKSWLPDDSITLGIAAVNHEKTVKNRENRPNSPRLTVLRGTFQSRPRSSYTPDRTNKLNFR